MATLSYRNEKIFLAVALAIFTLLISQRVNAQGGNRSSNSVPLNQKELNHVFNTAFSKLVTGNANSGEIANYISLDPVNATLNLKGSVPLAFPKKPGPNSSFTDDLIDDPRYISYLSFSVDGSLVDKNYGALFSNSSLNSGVNVGAQYNFRLWKRKHYSFFLDEWNDYNLRRELLIQRFNRQKIEIQEKLKPDALQRQRNSLSLDQISKNLKYQKNQRFIETFQQTMDGLGDAIKDRPGLIDSMQALVKENATLTSDLQTISSSIDSVDRVAAHIEDQKTLQLLDLEARTKKDYDTLLSHVQLQTIHVGWFTLSGTYSRNSYSVFADSLPFAAQITKEKLNDVNLGVAYNYLAQNRYMKHTFFLNAAFSRLRVTNLATLSTTTIEQQRTILNSVGDTSRKISNKYNVYTDPVESTMAWNTSLQLYYLFGKTPMGFHVYPSVNFQDNGHTLWYLTLGYIIAFKNAKDQSIVNTELYIRFNDVFDESDKGGPFHRRNEIGVSVAIPFNIF